MEAFTMAGDLVRIVLLGLVAIVALALLLGWLAVRREDK